MGMDLSGRGGYAYFNWFTWGRCLTVALAFGWEPAGTVSPDLSGLGIGVDEEDIYPNWDGSYFSNDHQQVTDLDARSLSLALGRALAAVATGQIVIAEQAKVRELADFAAHGGFTIA